jgi:hypothetical protein
MLVYFQTESPFQLPAFPVHIDKWRLVMSNGVPELYRGVVLDIWRHGHAAPADKDLERVLSEKGRTQSATLGAILKGSNDVDYVVCSAAPRTQQTAVIAMFPPGFARRIVTDWWYNGIDRSLYSFSRDDDHAAFLKMSEKAGSISYAAHKAVDEEGLIAKLRDEIRGLIGTFPDIGRAAHVAIFNHAVVGNIVAEALFPQHTDLIERIDLDACEAIRLTAETCEHYRPLAH